MNYPIHTVRMTHQTLTILLKKLSFKEHKICQHSCENCTNATLTAWAKQKFNLATEPGKAVMSRIVRDAELVAVQNSTASRECSIYRRKRAKLIELESTLYDWVCDMSNGRWCISGTIVQAKAQKLAGKINSKLMLDMQVATKFSKN